MLKRLKYHWSQYFEFKSEDHGDSFIIIINTPLFSWIYLANWKYWAKYTIATGFILCFIPNLFAVEGDFLYKYRFEYLDHVSFLGLMNAKTNHTR